MKFELQIQGGNYGPLILAVIERLSPPLWHDKGTGNAWRELEALFQAGAVGALEAEKSFDPKRRVPFGAYAEPYIRHAVSEELRRQGGRVVTIPERERKRRALWRLNRYPVSTSEPAFRDDDETTVENILTDRNPRGKVESEIGFNWSPSFGPTGGYLDGEEAGFRDALARVEALASVYEVDGSNAIHERNVRIIVSVDRDLELATLLDYATEREHLPRLLTDPRALLLRDYYFADEVQGNRHLVATTVYDHPVSAEQAQRDREALQRDSKTAGRVEMADARLTISWTWPYKSTTVTAVAAELNLTRQQVSSNVLGPYRKALRQIRRERRKS